MHASWKGGPVSPGLDHKTDWDIWRETKRWLIARRVVVLVFGVFDDGILQQRAVCRGNSFGLRL